VPWPARGGGPAGAAEDDLYRGAAGVRRPVLAGQLRGTVGTVALAPHARMTEHTELPVLYRDVQKLIEGTVPTPHLDQLLSAALLLCRAM